MGDNVLTLVTGDTISLVVVSTDPATGAMTTDDGSVLYPDGSIVKGNIIVLPSGNVVDASTGTMTMPDGTVTVGASADPAAIDQIQTVIAGAGGLVTSLATTIQQIIGAVSGGSTVLSAGYRRLPDGRIQMPDGTIVTPTVLGDGRLMLPNGRLLPASFGQSSFGSLGLVAVVAAVGYVLLKKKRAA